MEGKSLAVGEFIVPVCSEEAHPGRGTRVSLDEGGIVPGGRPRRGGERGSGIAGRGGLAPAAHEKPAVHGNRGLVLWVVISGSQRPSYFFLAVFLAGFLAAAFFFAIAITPFQ